MRIVLASGSEWRKRLLVWMGLPFEVIVSNLDEDRVEGEEPEEMVARLAVNKAEEVVRNLSENDGLVIGADTVIVVDDEVVGKPVNERHAKDIMGKLEGREHRVLTGLCVVNALTNEKRVEVEETVVVMAKMNRDEIERYIKTKDWVGKAGAYQILGAITPYVMEVRDSVTNVIGMPLGLLAEMLNGFGVDVEVDVRRVIERETGYGK